jgi:hypothetical protein
VDGVIGLSHGCGHIIFGYFEAFSPRFFPCTWSMTFFFFVEIWRYLTKKIWLVWISMFEDRWLWWE